MIKKYFKNNITKCIPLFIFSFVFVLLFLYSYSIVNANNYLSNEIKNTVTSEIELSGRMFSLDVSDDFIFSSNDDVKEELNNVMDALDKYNASYDLMCQVVFSELANNEYAFDNENIITYLPEYVYGIDDDSYFKDNNIELIDCDGLKEDDEGIIVSEDLYVATYEDVILGTSDGYTYYEHVKNGARKVELGDTISIPMTTNKNYYNYFYGADYYVDYTVVGFYKNRSVDMEKYQTSDYMLNNRMYVTKDGFLNLANEYFGLYTSVNIKTTYTYLSGSLSQFKFNNVTFDIKDYEELSEVRTDLQSLLSKINNASLSQIKPTPGNRTGYQATQYTYNVYKVSSTEDLVNKIISPFSSLSENINMYKNIFIAISIIMFGLIILFSVRNRIKESSIKMAMGMKYEDVLYEIIIENIIVVLLGCILAIFIYNLTVTKIVSNMLIECIDLQNSLYRITSKDIEGLDDAFSIFADFSNVKVSIVYYLIITAICILISVLLTLLVYKTNQPKNVKRALMSF